MLKFSSSSDYPHNFFMNMALEQAEQAFSENEVPVGAVIVNRLSKEIISKAYNMVEQGSNSTLHAEMIAINKSCNALKSKNLSDCDIYITLEPCAMCSTAISLARIGRLFYSANDKKQGAVENGLRYFTSSSCFHRPEIYPGFGSEFSVQLIKKFFSKIRKDKL